MVVDLKVVDSIKFAVTGQESNPQSATTHSPKTLLIFIFVKRIVRTILYLMLIFLFSSCATLITRKDYSIKVSTDLQNARAEILDSIYSLPANFKIKRSKEDLKIKLIGDSLKKNYVVKASPNSAFLYGNLIAYPIFPAMYGVDFTNQKRFYYGKSIFLNSSATTETIRPKISKGYYDYWSRNYPTNKGQINFTYSFPWVNSFYLHPSQETPKINTGFWGISAGFEYFYRGDKYISLTGSAVMDFFIPFPAAVDFSGEVETMYSVYTSLTDNYKFRRFTIGYGANFSKNTWRIVYHDRFEPLPPTREPATKTSNSVGFTLDGYHQVGKRFYIGLIYRPTILNVYPDIDFKYEHLISLDFKWKIPLKK